MDHVNVGDTVQVTFKGKVTAKKTTGVQTLSVQRDGSQTVSYFEQDEFGLVRVEVLQRHFEPVSGQLYRVRLNSNKTGGALWFVTRQDGELKMASRIDITSIAKFREAYCVGDSGFIVEQVQVP